MSTTRTLKRAGLPSITFIMLGVLKLLRDADQRDQPFVHFDEHEVWNRTLKALVNRDWIVPMDFNSRKYRITGRGRKALKVYDAPSPKRIDGICPRCGENPVGVYRTGRKKAYCPECMNRIQRRQYAFRGHCYTPDRLCPGCQKCPRYVCSTGFIKPYCGKCLRQRAKQERRRKHIRLLERIRSGELLPCPKCGRQRHNSPNTVYDWCYEHYREYQNEYLRRRTKANKEQSDGTVQRLR